MLPDVTGITKTFDYVVPDSWSEANRKMVQVGSIVRFDLGGRRLRGWVVGCDVEPAVGVSLRALTKVTGYGPSADIVELAHWAADRWVGHPSRLLVAASPLKAVTRLSAPRPAKPIPEQDPFVESAFERDRSVVQLPPRGASLPYALAAARRGNALILVPSVTRAKWLSRNLADLGVRVAAMPEGWARAASGATVVGGRAAAWAPVNDLAAVVVFDEHDEVYQDERSPTWNARDVAQERARRAGVPCVVLSPNPTLESVEWGDLLLPERPQERAGWPRVEIIDRRSDDIGRTGLFSDTVVRALRDTTAEDPIVFVLNRKGRARLLACTSCGELGLCDVCSSALKQHDEDLLECSTCGTNRPVVCGSCGSSTFKRIRMGVTRAREELEALAGRKVVEVSASSTGTKKSGGARGARKVGAPEEIDLASADVFVGTEAVLHRIKRASAVVFLDFDQELGGLRYRSAEQAFGFLVRAARLLGPRKEGGRLLVQTRKPEHEVLRAAAQSDPSILRDAEKQRRQELRLPPYSAMAAISGSVAEEFIASLPPTEGVMVQGPIDERWLVRAANHEILGGFLRSVDRPAGRMRIEVDPLRV